MYEITASQLVHGRDMVMMAGDTVMTAGTRQHSGDMASWLGKRQHGWDTVMKAGTQHYVRDMTTWSGHVIISGNRNHGHDTATWPAHGDDGRDTASRP